MIDLFPTARGKLRLRPYQSDTVAMVAEAFDDGARAPLVVGPTGSGKTVIAAELIRREIATGGRALFIAPRRELITHASRKLADAGIAHGVILAGADHLHDPDAAAQIASIDTLQSRIMRRGLLSELPGFTLVVIDEAHLAVTAKRIALLDRWPNARRVGLTATPIRKDGRALGVLFDRLIEPATTSALTDAGFLVPGRYFSLSEPDLVRVRIVAGDFNIKDLDAAMNRAALVGDIVGHWLRHAPKRRTVVFCTSIPHSVAIAETFQRAGVTAEHVDASTPTSEREDTFLRFTRGETQILTNCFLASYGFDLPALSCVVLARPTKSLMLYLQMVGRGLRPADGKADCLVLDHSGCVHRHGFAHDARAWTLDGHRDMGAGAASSAPAELGERKQIDCPECKAVFAATITCPECGHRLTPRGRDVATLSGELVEIDKQAAPMFDHETFYRELCGLADERGYNLRWPACQFRERFNEWPPWEWSDETPLAPTIETRRWVKSRQIAYAKARRTA